MSILDDDNEESLKGSPVDFGTAAVVPESPVELPEAPVELPAAQGAPDEMIETEEEVFDTVIEEDPFSLPSISQRYSSELDVTSDAYLEEKKQEELDNPPSDAYAQALASFNPEKGAEAQRVLDTQAKLPVLDAAIGEKDVEQVSAVLTDVYEATPQVALQRYLDNAENTKKAEAEYDTLTNQVTKFTMGITELPRYLGSIPGLIDRVLSDAPGTANFLADVETDKAMHKVFNTAPSYLDDLYDEYVVDPVVKGETRDATFEKNITKVIETEYGVSLSAKFKKNVALRNVITETIATGGTALLKNLLVRGIVTGARSAAPGATQDVLEAATLGLNKRTVKMLQASTPELVKATVKGTTYAALGGSAAVLFTEDVVKMIDPETKEGKVLAEILLDIGISVGVSGAAAGAVKGYAKLPAVLSPTKLVVNTSKFVYKKAGALRSEMKKMKWEKEQIEINPVETQAERSHRWYTEEGGKGGIETWALDTLHREDVDTKDRTAAVTALMDIALEDPSSRASHLFNNVLPLFKDDPAIQKAVTEVEAFTIALGKPDFQATLLTFYEGKYSDAFLKIAAERSPDVIIKEQQKFYTYLTETLKNERLSHEERSTLQAQAVELASDIEAHAQVSLTIAQQELTGALQFLSNPESNLKGDSYKKLRTSLTGINNKIKQTTRSMYGLIDPENKIKVTNMFSVLNDVFTGTSKSSTSYGVLKKAQNEATFKYLMSNIADANSVIPDIFSNTPESPLSHFDTSVVESAKDIVYLTQEQYRTVFGEMTESTGKTTGLKTLPSVTMKTDGASFTIDSATSTKISSSLDIRWRPVHIKGLSQIEVSKGLKKIDVNGKSITLDLARNLEAMDDKSRINNAIYYGFMESVRLLKDGDSHAGQTLHNTFSPMLDLTKTDLNYKTAQRMVSDLHSEASAAWAGGDMEKYSSLSNLAKRLSDNVDVALSKDPSKAAYKKALDEQFKTNIMEKQKDKKSILGASSLTDKNRVYSKFVSKILDEAEGTPELLGQLAEVLGTNPNQLLEGFKEVRSRHEIAKVIDLDKSLGNFLMQEGKNMSDAIASTYLTEAFATFNTLIDTGTNPVVSAKSVITGLMDQEVFTTALEGMSDGIMKEDIKRVLAFADDADIMRSINSLMTEHDKYKKGFYPQLTNLVGGSSSSVLAMLKNLDDTTLSIANASSNGTLTTIAPMILKIASNDIITFDQHMHLNPVATSAKLELYKAGLKVLPNGKSLIKTLETQIKVVQKGQSLSSLKGKAKIPEKSKSTGFMSSLMGKVFKYAPRVMSDLRTARKNIISTEHAIISSTSSIAVSELKSLGNLDAKIPQEIIAHAITDPSFISKMETLKKFKDIQPKEKLRLMSAWMYVANGLRSEALDSYLRYLEFKEEGKEEEALAEIIQYEVMDDLEETKGVQEEPTEAEVPKENPELTQEDRGESNYAPPTYLSQADVDSLGNLDQVSEVPEEPNVQPQAPQEQPQGITNVPEIPTASTNPLTGKVSQADITEALNNSSAETRLKLTEK